MGQSRHEDARMAGHRGYTQSSTVSLESLMLSCAIDMKEK